MAPPLPDLFSKQLIIVSGKGGVGKTVVSSALGLIASSMGKNVLLVKMDDSGRTTQLFGVPEALGDRVLPLRENISAINLDPVTIVADYFQKQLRIRKLVKHIVGSKLFQNWFRVSPAIKEMICLGKVQALVEETSWWRKTPTYDLVIFDAPATGHGLGLLKLPEQASKLLIGGMRKSALSVSALLKDQLRTALVLVTIPEEMPVNETIHFYEGAKALGMPLACVILNAAFPDRFSDRAEGEALDEGVVADAARALFGDQVPDSAAAALRKAARYSTAQRGLTERYAGELAERVDLTRIEVPYVFTESFGFSELEGVASALGRAVEEAR